MIFENKNRLTPEKTRKLGHMFLDLHADKRKVDMMKSHFDPCGTIACHAGWFAIMTGIPYSNFHSFIDAADKMATFLGLQDAKSLEIWARHNADIWGNAYGNVMFTSWHAFDPDLNRLPNNLKTIGEHWLAVADRLERSPGV